MGIPTGAGTEVLKNTSIIGFSGTGNGWWSVRWDGNTLDAENASFAVPTDHIITVLSINVCNTHATQSYPFSMGCRTNSSTDTKYILKDQDVPANGTFIYSDKIILSSGDKLLFKDEDISSGDDFDVLISYIDQHF